jgi:hypothetical protein
MKDRGCIPETEIKECFLKLSNGKSGRWSFYSKFVVDLKGDNLEKARLTMLNKAVRNNVLLLYGFSARSLIEIFV